MDGDSVDGDSVDGECVQSCSKIVCYFFANILALIKSNVSFVNGNDIQSIIFREPVLHIATCAATVTYNCVCLWYMVVNDGA